MAVDESGGKCVRDVVSEGDLTELFARCNAAAAARGQGFFFDETYQLMGEHAHAQYLRALASSVNMDDLAARLNSAKFKGEGPHTNFQ